MNESIMGRCPEQYRKLCIRARVDYYIRFPSKYEYFFHGSHPRASGYIEVNDDGILYFVWEGPTIDVYPWELRGYWRRARKDEFEKVVFT